jgi:hypothetical protein
LAGVKCCIATVKMFLRTSLQHCYIRWSFIDASTIKCCELNTAHGREGCCTYLLSLMYRIIQTCNFYVFLLWLMLPRLLERFLLLFNFIIVTFFNMYCSWHNKHVYFLVPAMTFIYCHRVEYSDIVSSSNIRTQSVHYTWT